MLTRRDRNGCRILQPLNFQLRFVVIVFFFRVRVQTCAEIFVMARPGGDNGTHDTSCKGR